MTGPRALTLHQPWASLVALLVKRIETRSWSTKYRGRLYIHAGLHLGRPPLGSWWWVNGEDGYVLWSKGGRDHPRDESMPLGAIVATCELVDVVPTEALCWTNAWPDWRLLQVMDDDPGPSPLVGDLQRPYGDFRPGRFAWLLDDIKPVDPPVPCRGRQGLWTPPEDVLAAVA